MDDTTRHPELSVRALLARSWERPLVVGHRGSAATHAENTLPAFEEAILCGAHAVECDVHASSDGHLVVVHDPTLERTTPLSGPVCEKPLRELQSVGIPSFGELLDLVQGRIVLITEIKAGPDVARQVVQALMDRGMTEQAALLSFDEESVREAKRANKGLYCVWLCGEVPGQDAGLLVEKLSEASADALGLPFWEVGKLLALELRSRGVPLFVWTVPPGYEVNRLRKMGANFVITDHPREVLLQLNPE